jgi:exosortase/archaeosortase family protein
MDQLKVSALKRRDSNRGGDIEIRYPPLESSGPALWSFLAPLVLFLLWGIVLRDTARTSKHLAPPSFEQVALAVVLSGLLLLGSLWLLHPAPARFAALQEMALRLPEAGDALLHALLGVFLLLPTLLLPTVFLPLSLFLRHRLGILLGLIGGVALLFFPVLEAAYFRFTGPPLVAVLQRTLALLPGSVPAGMNRWQVGYGDFVATVGYACTEFSATALFVILFATALYSMRRRKRIAPSRAAIVIGGGILLLWVLNILRIASIVVIGSYHPRFAMTLFHSGIGMLLFLLFFLVYIRFCLPWVQAKKTKKAA